MGPQGASEDLHSDYSFLTGYIEEAIRGGNEETPGGGGETTKAICRKINSGFH